MSPPAIIVIIVRPHIFIKPEESPVRTVCGYISSFFITLGILINALSVKPFIERTTVIENSVENNFHAPFVNFLDKLSKKTVARLKVFFVCNPAHIFCCIFVWVITVTHEISIFVPVKHFTLIFNYLSEMRIYIIIILNIIFVI